MVNLLKNLHLKKREEKGGAHILQFAQFGWIWGGFGEKQRNKVSDGCIRDT